MKSARWLAYLSHFGLLGLAALFGCDRPGWSFSDTVPVAGGGGSQSAAAGSAGACAMDRSKGPMPVFAGQTVMNTSPARRELYAYVTDAEADLLRSGKTLVPPSTPVTTVATTQLMRGSATANPARRAFIEALVPRFQRVRSTWPNPWALRLVNHAASEHMNPVRIVLRKEAWLVRVNNTSLVVSDLNNQEIKDDAVLDPDRVAAVFVLAVPQSGSTGSCETGFRDLALGNESMVESWSLGTPEILERLQTDMQLLTELFAISRQCSSVDRPGSTFHSATVCTTWANSTAATEYTTYGWSLANPAELYKPNVQNLLGLIDALKGDVFEPDPLVVTPTVVAAGGAGGAAAGGAAGDGGTEAAGGAP